jgi:sortase A
LNREPKISEIEKLIEHFKLTDREQELDEILHRHNIKARDEVLSVIDNDHEFHEEAIVVNKMAWHEGVIKKTKKPTKKLIWIFRNKWYVRFGFYWLVLFVFVFSFMNAPILVSRVSVSEKEPDTRLISYQETQVTPMDKSAPLEPGEVIPTGNFLKIPKLKINVPIQFPDTSEESVIQQYLTRGVVHYAGTAIPGEVGNVFITGHSSNFWWMKGNFNYVFVNLDKLIAGDRVIIYYEGNKYVYKVSSQVVVIPTDVSVLAQTDTPTLSLMTCTPPGTNWKRLVVKLNQISPVYTKPKVVTKTYQEPINLPSTDKNSIGAWLNTVWKAIIGN